MRPAPASVCLGLILYAMAACGRAAQYRVIPLPQGIMDIHEPLIVDANTEVRGSPRGSAIRMAEGFTGRAAMVLRGNGVRLRNFTILGNRDQLEVRSELPPYDRPFANFTERNGILADARTGIAIENLRFYEMAGFAILISRSHNVSIQRVTVEASGSRNAVGSNNATGGILLEEGTTDFLVANCDFHKIRGNALWTHSLYASPRNARGVFARNLSKRLAAMPYRWATPRKCAWNSTRARASAFP